MRRDQPIMRVNLAGRDIDSILAAALVAKVIKAAHHNGQAPELILIAPGDISELEKAAAANPKAKGLIGTGYMDKRGNYCTGPRAEKWRAAELEAGRNPDQADRPGKAKVGP